MKVILTEKVKSVGSIGDIVNVSAGFARNFLIRNKLAILADETNSNIMADFQKKLATKIAHEKDAAKEAAKKIQGQLLTFAKKVGGNGKLFGTVTTTEMANEFFKLGVDVDKRCFNTLNPIKSLGTFEVKAKLFKDVEATFKVKVEMDAAQAEEMKKKQAEGSSKKAKKAAAAAAATAEGAEATTEENSDAVKA